MRTFVLSLLVAVTVASACSRAPLGAKCDDHTDCADMLFCAQGGDLRGLCVAECAVASDNCEARFGDSSICLPEGVCARKCQDNAGCNGAACVDGLCTPGKPLAKGCEYNSECRPGETCQFVHGVGRCAITPAQP